MSTYELDPGERNKLRLRDFGKCQNRLILEPLPHIWEVARRVGEEMYMTEFPPSAVMSCSMENEIEAFVGSLPNDLHE